MDGAAPLAPGFDTCGWFARDAEIMARVGQLLLGGVAATPGRLLLAEDAFAYAMPDAAVALKPALTRVSALLGTPEPVTVSAEGLAAWFEVFRVLQVGEIQDVHGEWVARVRPTFGPQIAPRFAAVAKSNPDDIARMRLARADIAARLDAMLADNAVLVLPTMPDIAPLLQSPPDDTVAFRERALGMLCVAGLGGLPQVTLPFVTLNGCPIGLSLIAGRGQDEMLLEIARQLGS